MQEICAFFGVPASHNLTWRHRVNTGPWLAEAVADPALMILEGDVVLDPTGIPMMANPFEVNGEKVAGDLTFQDWVTTASAHQKGVKIDLHTPGALIPVLQTVAEKEIETPVILHADIFNLLEATEGEFEPEMFVQQAQRLLPSATLSLGWSLSHTQDADGKLESLLIDQMTELLLTKLGGVSYMIEFRAGYTPRWERGAAFIFEPMDNIERPAFGENVIDGIALFRKDVFVGT